MATFKVGQRVRITVAGRAPERRAGSTGTVSTNLFMTGFGPGHGVIVDGLPSKHPDGWGVPVYALAPLTDPKAEEFLADMERFAKLAREGNAPRIPHPSPAFGD